MFVSVPKGCDAIFMKVETATIWWMNLSTYHFLRFR